MPGAFGLLGLKGSGLLEDSVGRVSWFFPAATRVLGGSGV